MFHEQEIRVLLVEDEKKLAHLTQRQLQRAGYSVEVAYDGMEAKEKILSSELSLIILDLNLPKKSGFEVLQEVRSQALTIPVIIVSGRSKVEDRIKSLGLGADDYLMKPFDSSELLARVSSLLRRSGRVGMSILQAGDLTMDVAHHTVKRGSESIALSPKEFKLLEFFLNNKNQVLTRKRIAEYVWGPAFDSQTNVVDVYVSYLRRLVDKGFKKKLIHTLHGEGFILSE
ncbi:MAG TPA: response regulator transcription factor [Bacteroidota bacterium]|nr:response regulator transcription factor [Bacteroidota bacterium]